MGALIILISCANPLPPSGGPPDTTPPRIISTKPGNATMNYSGNSISLEFNKYMDRNKVTESAYLSPPKRVEYSWSGRTLKIDFLEELDSNTTYAFNLGSEYSDIYGNKPSSAFAVIFSTGSDIDSGRIDGELIGKEPAGSFVYAYRIDDINPDTLDIRHTKSKYRVQVGTNGKFSIRALKNGTYRLIALNDVFRNEIYDEGIDNFASATEDVALKGDSIGLIMIKTGGIIDKSKPQLFEVISINSFQLMAVFSEDIDTSSISINSFILTDSVSGVRLNIHSAFLDVESGKRLLINAKDEMSVGQRYRLSCDTSELALRDLAGNRISDTAFSRSFSADGREITQTGKLVKAPFQDSTVNVSLDARFPFIFNFALQSEGSGSAFSLFKTGDTVETKYLLEWYMDNTPVIVPEEKLEGNMGYALRLDLSKIIDIAGKSIADSSVTIRFWTEDLRSSGSVSGKVTSEITGDIYIVFSDGKHKRQAKLKDDKSWSIPEIPPGQYSVELFYDFNGNGLYDFGNSFPFILAEKFKIFESKITVKGRWELENVIFPFP